MPFNGTGTFSRIYSWVTDQANNIFVRADRMDTDTNDIATAWSNCITRDGQSPATAAIPMGGQKITGLGNGAAPQDATTVLQVFTSPTFYGAATFAAITASGAAVDLSGATTVKVPTAAVGDNSTNAASTAFAVALAFSAALPTISAINKGKLVYNDGAIGSWGPSSAALNSLNYSLFGAL